jgi:hypothetical protein
VENHGTSNLLSNVEEPDLPLTFGRLAESLEDQGEQSQDAERALYKQSEWPEEFALILFGSWVIFGRLLASNASSGGMVNVRVSPGHMFSMPWSQPLITCPRPTMKMNGFLSNEDSTTSSEPYTFRL